MAHKTTNVSRQSSEDLNALKESNSEADFTMNEAEEKKPKRKDSKKLFSKKDSKDKGYSSLNPDNSQEVIFLTKSSKKAKHDKIGLFKKSEKKDEKKSREQNDDSKRSKHEKLKKHDTVEKEKTFFANTLDRTLVEYPSNDAINIPHPIRVCFDIIEDRGLDCEGIYRRHLNKSQIEILFETANENFDSKINNLNADPFIAAAIVKKFLRELKTPLISDELLTSFDKCESISNKELELKIETVQELVKQMPNSNRDLFSYLMVHLNKLIRNSDVNKMDIANMVLVFQPIIKIKERILKFIIRNAGLIFKSSTFKKYRYKVTDDSASRISALPESIVEIENEIAKQESVLYKLHSRISVSDKDKQEPLLDELWALQRYITSLKRKAKKLKQEEKNTGKMERQETLTSTSSSIANQNNITADTDISLDDASSKKLDNDIYYDTSENELIRKICENEILIENVQHLIEKNNREKVKIFDLQQKFNSMQVVLQPNDSDVIGVDSTNLDELKNFLENIYMENKQLENKILALTKKISMEKAMIFDFKLHIECQALTNTIQKFKVNSYDAISKTIEVQSDQSDRNGAMTKL